MRLKIIICLIVSYCIYLPSAIAISGDTIRQLTLSDKLIENVNGGTALAPMPYAFFDEGIHQFYFQIDITHKPISTDTPFLFVEVKKKSAQQFRLRPITSKKISVTQNDIYIDSLLFVEDKFASGNFDLIVSYMQDSFTVLNVKKIPFQLYRANNVKLKDEFYEAPANKTINDVDITKTFVQKYDVPTLQKNILAVQPLAQPVEVKVIKELAKSKDIQILKQFFYNFWFNRDPAGPEKAWTNYASILNEVSKKYSYGGIPGYETDRGRIHIRYGAADRIVRAPNEKGALPYEVWFYYTSGDKGNVKFLFYQPGVLTNEMLLLHSNQVDELINPYWKEQLLQDPNDGDNKLKHKVFEFFNQ